MVNVPWWVVVALVLACLIPSVVQLVVMGDMARDMRRMAKMFRVLSARAHTGEDPRQSTEVVVTLDGHRIADRLGISEEV